MRWWTLAKAGVFFGLSADWTARPVDLAGTLNQAGRGRGEPVLVPDVRQPVGVGELLEAGHAHPEGIGRALPGEPVGAAWTHSRYLSPAAAPWQTKPRQPSKSRFHARRLALAPLAVASDEAHRVSVGAPVNSRCDRYSARSVLVSNGPAQASVTGA